MVETDFRVFVDWIELSKEAKCGLNKAYNLFILLIFMAPVEVVES